MSRRARRGRRIRPPETCKATPPGGRDGLSGWFVYFCTDGILLVPTPRCVGPECQGRRRATVPVLGFAGDLDTGNRGSFAAAGRLAGLSALSGVEVAQGLNQIEQAADRGEISDAYARAAMAAYRRDPGAYTPVEPGIGVIGGVERPIAPGAYGRLNYVGAGGPVGPDVREACACTPREFDAIDVISGWGIYYVEGGVWMTPSKKCVAGGGRPPSFWQQTWRNVLSLVGAAPPAPQPVRLPPPGAPAPLLPVPGPAPSAPSATGGYLCLHPNVFPPAYRPKATPCVPPEVPYPG